MDEEARYSLLLVHDMSPLLDVQDLHVAYRTTGGGECPAIAGVSFEIQPGETLGVLGESGSGKSTLAAALLRLLPANGKIQKGAIRFEGQDLLRAEPHELEKIRGGRIGLIFQEPSMALHPTIRVGEQIGDVIAAHEDLDKRTLREKTMRVLAAVFSTDTKRIAASFPHELSGGQRQRVLMAQAIACNPSLLIADEPMASLDPSTQQEILALVQTLREKLKLALIFITHNPAILASLANRILVLYAGRVVEVGPTQTVLASPQHPYTRALLGCLPPQIGQERSPHKSKLPAIPGESPNLAQLVNGCRFEPRCTDRMDVCSANEPSETLVGSGHIVSCFKYGD